MLEHSTQFRDQGATVQVADARHLKLPSSRFALVFSSLGDSFNLRGFWREARRVLRPGGEILFSAPSFEWAEYYRAKYQESRYEAAMFETRSAGKAYVDSYVLPVEEQRKLIADAGLRPVAVQHVTLGELATARISPKLLSPQGASLRIVTGFAAVKSAP
jgi:SAM-dependent methyltransferase